MIIKSFKKYFFTYVVPTFYGGGSGGGQNTTVQQRNIPKELAPYYEVLLGSMMKQGFTSAENPGKPAPKVAGDWSPRTTGYAKGGEVKGDGIKHYLAGGVTDSTLSNLGLTAANKFNPTGIVSYQPSPFTMDESGNYDPNKTVAPTTGLQNLSYKSAAEMQLPEQNVAASNFVSNAGMGGLNTANSGLEYGAAGYQAGLNSADIGNAAATGAAQNATMLGNNALNYGGTGAISGMSGQALGVLGGNAYGQMGANAGVNAANLGNTGANVAQTNAQTIGNAALTYGNQGADYGREASYAGQDYGRAAQDTNVVSNYMNPYLKQSLQPQLDLMDQQNDILNQKANSQAAAQGAYGGSRSLVAKNLNDQSNKLAQAALIGQGYNTAYDKAQGNILNAANLGLQGQQAGMQGAGVGLQGTGAATSAANLGLSGVQTGIQGQQAAMQGAGVGLSGVNAQLAGTAQGMQGAGVGLSGVNAATGAGQYGLQGAGVGLSGQQQAISGAQTGLAGVGAAQAGYGLAGNAGQQLMGLGNQQLAQQQSIAGIQNQYGAQQQALNQQAINNAITYNDYQQKYPWEVLGNIGNALNGVQVGNMSQYTPSPSLISQVGGLGATALGAYGANGGFKAKKGGKVPKAQGSGIGDLAVYNAMKGGK